MVVESNVQVNCEGAEHCTPKSTLCFGVVRSPWGTDRTKHTFQTDGSGSIEGDIKLWGEQLETMRVIQEKSTGG